VITTTVGRYLIQHDDWHANNPPDVPRPEESSVPASGEAGDDERRHESARRQDGGKPRGC
jgi:hypothetical protein